MLLLAAAVGAPALADAPPKDFAAYEEAGAAWWLPFTALEVATNLSDPEAIRRLHDAVEASPGRRSRIVDAQRARVRARPPS